MALVEASSASGAAAKAKLDAARQILSEIVDNSAGDLETGISARVRMAEGLAGAAEFEAAGNTLEALRLLTRVIGLSASLADLERKPGAPVPALDKATKAIYQRIAALGSTDKNTLAPLGLAKGETLIYRALFADGADLAAFELAGDPAAPKVEWRETRLGKLGPDRAGALRQVLKRGETAKSAAPQFALLLGSRLGPRNLKEEQGLVTIAAALPEALLGFEPSSAGRRPLTLVPQLPSPATQTAVADAQLVHVPTLSTLVTWPAGQKQPLKDIIAGARAAIAEVSTDLGLKPAAVAPAAFVEEPRAVRGIDPKTGSGYRAVSKAVTVASVASDATIELEPYSALEPEATLAGWGRYKIFGTEDSIWLPETAVGPYVEYPEEARSSGGWMPSFFSKTSTPRRVGGRAAILLARASQTSESIGSLKSGEELQVLHSRASADGKSGWAFVKAPGEVFGWVAEAALAVEAPPALETGAADGPAKPTKPAPKD